MKILAVNNISSQRNSFKANPITSSQVQQSPSDTFKKKRSQIYTMAGVLFAVSSTFAYFWVFHRNSKSNFLKERLDEAKRFIQRNSSRVER